jgi:hypothetical protein
MVKSVLNDSNVSRYFISNFYNYLLKIKNHFYNFVRVGFLTNSLIL